MDARRVAGWIVFLLGAVGLAALAATAVAQLLAARGWSTPLSLFGTLAAAVLPLAFALVGWRLAHPVPLGPVERRVVTPVPVVPAADAEALPMPVAACPDCGYLDIRMPTIHDGLWPGGGETGDRMVCPRCDWQGLPARFDSGAQYAAFVAELHEGRPAPS